jgi:hypothetical protein
VAGSRRKQRAINAAKLRPRDLATQILKLVAQHHELDVLCVRAAATTNERSQQGP